MGSAVGKQKELRDKVRSSQADTAGFFKDMQERRDVEWRERPDAETVVGECTSPEWEQPDSIVFSKPTDFAKKQQRQGRFFSKLYRFIGTWKLDQNCLFLRWDGKDGAMDVLRADRLEMEYTNPQTKMCVKISEPTVLPFWFTPDCVSKRFERSDESLKNFECGVCYFELWKSRAAAMRRYTRRVCEHYIHYECATHLLEEARTEHGRNEAECPVCGARFNEVKEVPDILKDPRGWFQIVDADYGGELNRVEVLNGLGTTMPIAREKLEAAIENHWHEWDPDGSGTITTREFMLSGNGLKDYIVRHIKELEAKTAGKGLALADIPDLDTHPHEWFEYWDADNSGTLEQHEMIRAFIRTFCVTNWGEPILRRAFDMRKLAAVVWNELGFHPLDSIDFETFLEPDGLADTFIHNQIHLNAFGTGSQGF
eukprot:CAMPEP_0178988272 /NCGR_PEP_ID=MMETSP0795-20121207/3723_1 /TAXON_ID=88552 /ORGANISM="Amoebophrya sp., Strain Ameob2" /LENGTH=425 /DNA_ID=CAMNT_0020679537 /DNA_START=640 /DNA_END=1917 /DNA_ORIENTATION=+